MNTPRIELQSVNRIQNRAFVYTSDGKVHESEVGRTLWYLGCVCPNCGEQGKGWHPAHNPMRCHHDKKHIYEMTPLAGAELITWSKGLPNRGDKVVVCKYE